MRLSYSINRETGVCHIVDSYEVTKRCDMRVFIQENLIDEPFNVRSINSYINEWRAHNLLYKLGLFKNRTKDVDLDIHEPTWRRIGYFILSLFYNGGK